MKQAMLRKIFGSVLAAALLVSSVAFAQSPYAGTRITVASMNDPFATALVKLTPKFTALTGIEVKVDILSYPELLSRLTADFVGKSKNYDVVTMDIVWAGQFAESGFTLDLNDWMKRDAAQLDLEDIYPNVLNGLGNYKGKRIAFPFTAYSNVLAYRKDLFDQAGLKAPDTMSELISDAAKLTDPAKISMVGRQMGVRGRRRRRTGCNTMPRSAAPFWVPMASRRSTAQRTSRA